MRKKHVVLSPTCVKTGSSTDMTLPKPSASSVNVVREKKIPAELVANTRPCRGKATPTPHRTMHETHDAEEPRRSCCRPREHLEILANGEHALPRLVQEAHQKPFLSRKATLQAAPTPSSAQYLAPGLKWSSAVAGLFGTAELARHNGTRHLQSNSKLSWCKNQILLEH